MNGRAAIATRLSLWQLLQRAARRRVLLHWYRWQLECLIAERDTYLGASAVGPEYLINCADQERDLNSRIARIQCDL